MTIYRVAVEGSHSGSQTVNVFHCTAPTGEESSIASEIKDWWVTDVVDFLSTDWTGVGVTVTDIIAKKQAFDGFTTGGAVSGDSCPPYVTANVTWKTAQVGRKYRGRTYFPAVPEANQAHGVLIAGAITLIETAATDLLLAFSAAGAEMVIYHRVDGTTTPVVAYKVRTITHVQIRRTLNYGT